MASKREKRIIKEFKELEESKDILIQSGIYFYYNEENINILYAMLYGPEGTPYEKGFYFFKFEYPESYPMSPPIANYCTQGMLPNIKSNEQFHVRFNPNLYVCKKVCLSMLNTWNGPGWVPTNTMSNVLVALQAIVLNEEPLKNEPGFEFSNKDVIDKYNNIIKYANIKISVLEMLETQPIKFDVFKDTMDELFLKNIEFYRNFILTNNDLLKDNIIESPAYGMTCKIDYAPLLYKIENYEKKIKMNMVDKLQIDKLSIHK